MIALWLGETSHSKIRIADRFDLEDSATLRNQIKTLVHRLKQDEDLGRLTHGTPGRKSGDVAEQNCAIGKEIRNWLLVSDNGLFAPPIQERFQLAISSKHCIAPAQIFLFRIQLEKSITDLFGVT